MKLPRFMFAAVILFWGWQWQLLALAAGLAIGVEWACGGYWQRQVDFTLLSRVSNACTLLFVSLAVYFAFTLDPARGVLAVIKWTPLMLLPLALVIGISGMAAVPLAIISAVVKRRNQAAPDRGAKANLAYPYLALWLLASGAANNQGPGFYIGVALLTSWALWSVRPVGRPLLLWLCLFGFAIAGGAAVNAGLYHLHGVIEEAAMNWMAIDGEEDPLRTETRLGHIGQLKLGNGIALRIKTKRVLFEPLLLRTASYNLYWKSSWMLTGPHPFGWVPSQDGSAQSRLWRLLPGAPDQLLEVDGSASHTNPVIALPPGTISLESKQFQSLTRNSFGTVQAKMTRGHYHYVVQYQSQAKYPGPPDAQDLVLPPNERVLLQNLVKQLQLSGQSDARALALIRNYFAKNFRYSTFRKGNSMEQSAIADFLNHSRQGHCEHFASASVLLLRAAGIPARYAVGYSVQEPDRLGQGYVVRQRHGHAWAMAFVDGAWQDFDTTPASWGQQEAGHDAWWSALGDAANWGIYQIRYQIRNGSIQTWHIALAILAILLSLRLKALIPVWVKPRQRRRVDKVQQSDWQTDSEFHQIAHHLKQQGYPRQPGEALHHWLARISPQLGHSASAALAQVIELHYQYRFGPPTTTQSTQSAQSKQLQQACQNWLKDFKKLPGKKPRK